MSTDILVTGDRLEVVCTGPCAQSDLIKLVDAIDAARVSGLKKCFMDASRAEFRLEGLGEFFVGEYAAKKLAGMRFAMLPPAAFVSRLLENAAYNRGLKFFRATTRAEAEAWLAV